MLFSEVLRSARLRLGISADDMAQRADVETSLLMSVESGKATTDDTYRLAAAVQAKCGYLFSPAELVAVEGMAQGSLGLREIRKLASITQKALAERLGVTQAAVSIWESGGSQTPTKHIRESLNIASSILGIGVPEVVKAIREQTAASRSARISVDPSASVSSTATLYPKVKVGARVVIGDRCVLRRGSSVRRGSRLGPQVTVDEGARIGAEVTIKENSRIGAGAIVRSGSNVPAGTHIPPGEIYYNG